MAGDRAMMVRFGSLGILRVFMGETFILGKAGGFPFVDEKVSSSWGF